MLVLKPIATFSLQRQRACGRQRVIRWQRLTGVLKIISLAGGNNSVPTTGLTPFITIVHVAM